MSAARRLPLFPVVVLLIYGAVVSWMFTTDHVARSFGAIALGVLAVALISLWWALHVRGQRLRRLLQLTVAAVLAVMFFKVAVRYDGSSDGTALPSLSWKWSHASAPAMPVLKSQTSTASDLGPVPAGLADWTRFMGPNGDGMLPPVEWNTDWKTHPPREVWRIPVGLGWSGFAVQGRRAVTMEQRDAEECITCYDAATGKLLWSHVDQTRFAEDMGGHGPRATPSINKNTGRVFTMGGTGILNCLDLITGELKWTKNVLTETGTKNLTWGKSNAPLLLGDRVIVSGGNAKPTLLCFTQASGELVWKSGDDGASYSTPLVLTLAGREQLVSVNQGTVTGHDVTTGATLWSFAWPSTFPKVSEPVPAGLDRILVTSSYGIKSHLLEVKVDASGKFTCHSVWANSQSRTKFSSATVLDGCAYALDEGTLVCMDLTSGERVWREGRYGFGQHLQAGKVLLIQSEPGDVVLVQPTREKLTELGRIKALSSKTWNPPTLAGRWLLVRNDREAVCYELQ